MDSRLLAGAYSQHFRALEQQNNAVDSDRIDSIARAKKLSLETNKRRRSQAQKRKVEAQREEKRRLEILSKRREEQKQATEKYQRSHIPPSARQHSGRRSPRRPGGGAALEDALRLIRASPRRPGSARERVMSPRKENEDPFEKSYFEKRGHHMARPGSGRVAHQIDSHMRAELMDHSLQNLTSSKTLFEQQLEQQQALLLQQQQQSMQAFNKAVRQEIDSDITNHDGTEDDDDNNYSNLDDSCSSLDSLEESKESDRNRTGNWSQEIQKAKDAAGKSELCQNADKAAMASDYNERQFQLHQHQNQDTLRQEPNDNYYPLNQDMTSSAIYQLPTAQVQEAQGALQGNSKNFAVAQTNSGLEGQMIMARSAAPFGKEQASNQYQQHATTLKQFSLDSIESGSSSSSISLIKNNIQNPSPQTLAVSNIGSTTSSASQMAWVPPSSKLETSTATLMPSNTINNNDSVKEGYNPRYASAISLSIWPGQGGNGPSSSGLQANSSAVQASQPSVSSPNPYSSKATPTAATSVASSSSTPGLISRNVSIASIYTSPTTTKSDVVLKSGIVGSSFSASTLANNATGIDMAWQDMQYPQVQDYRSLGGAQVHSLSQQQQQQVNPSIVAVSGYNQNSQLPPPPTAAASLHTYSHLATPAPHTTPQSINTFQHQNIQQQPHQQIHTPQYQQLQQHQNLLLQSQQHQQYQLEQKQFQVPQYQQQHASSHHVSQIPQGASAAITGIPVPAVRTIFPAQRPPVPKAETTGPSSLISASTPDVEVASTLKPNTSGQERVNKPSSSHGSTGSQHPQTKPLSEQDSEQVTVEESTRIKGILKAGPVVVPQQFPAKATGHPRDSLELTRMQAEKKVKKKSVRFAEGHAEKIFEEDKEPAGTKAMVITNSGTSIYRPAIARPASAKVVSTTQRTDVEVGKVARAASAGATRQVANTPGQAPLTKNVQFSYGHGQNENQVQQESPNDPSEQSNLPPSSHQALSSTNASGKPIINRPKAAAHIIMSNSEHHTNEEKPGMSVAPASSAHHAQAAAIAHKSHLESKVKNINSSVMPSRVPMKVPSSGSAVTVYHVARAGAEEQNNDYQNQQMHTAEHSGEGGKNAAGVITTQEQRQRLRDPSPASKRVPISNSVVTRTSIVPASTKISMPQSNTGAPSYSASSGGSGVGAVYDENGMRIDRTPTDEEITWLWDKVRNCLNKEEPGNSGGGGGVARAQNGSPGSAVDQSRQPPTLSTKLIDGASLGFGLSTSPGVNGLRTGAGFFQPHPSPSVQSNKVRPATQQQGSYLRRYGLLKQRRATSATGPGSAPTQQPPNVIQRASSAVHSRQQHQPSIASPSSQQAEHDGPPPTLNHAYVPQDGVSESTAAFIMAERLAKQSLSDSHIQSGMQDAQSKQETHNARARLAVNRGGHSALSIEEQNLLASLDKLNERLRVTDTHYTGTIHYHQPFQAHLPGFRGNHSPAVESRRHMLLSPRSQGQVQQRSQSARIRQQTRQYR